MIAVGPVRWMDNDTTMPRPPVSNSFRCVRLCIVHALAAEGSLPYGTITENG